MAKMKETSSIGVCVLFCLVVFVLFCFVDIRQHYMKTENIICVCDIFLNFILIY